LAINLMKTNVKSLVKQKLVGEVIHPELWVERNYVATWDGRPKLTVGIGGIVYNVRVGDPVFGWSSDHLNAGAAVSHTDQSRMMALNVFSCIGNKARVVDGEAKGMKGVVVGKTYFYPGRSYRIVVDFPHDGLSKLAIGDKVEVEAWGSGLAIEGFEDVRVLSLSPRLLEEMGVAAHDGKLRVPVVKELPGKMMGVGVGRGPTEAGAWDIQSCSHELNEELGLEKLRFGDIVAVRDVDSDWGHGVYEGGVVVGVVSHGASEIGGHGPGIAIIFSSKKGRLDSVVDEGANVARYLGLREDLV
jgi:hypothetical protein